MTDLKTKQRAFTLMELLVVMTIMSVVLALVAPMGINMVDKARAQTEYVQLQNLIKNQANKAFVTGQGIELVMQDNRLFIQANMQKSMTDAQKRFEHLSFDDRQVLRFNRNGIPSLASVEVKVGSISKLLSVQDLFQLPDELTPEARAQ